MTRVRAAISAAISAATPEGIPEGIPEGPATAGSADRAVLRAAGSS